MSIGAYLREMRTSRDMGLQEVSETTGISTRIIHALENEDREQLPAEVYIKAFYKKYAEFLGVDPEEILARYQQQTTSPKKAGRRYGLSTVITLKDRGENLFVEIMRRLFLPMAILLLGVLLYWLYKNYLAPYNPFAFIQENSSPIISFIHSHFSDFMC